MKTEELLIKYPIEIKVLVMEALNIIKKVLPHIIEMPDFSANIIGCGYGNKYSDIICTIILSKKGIKIGLNKGSALPDPCCLLQGSGKVHKHVQITNIQELQNPALIQLIKEGHKAWQLRSKQ